MLWLAPLQLRSGTMMSTFPTARSASARGPSASDSIPSSFVMRMCLRSSVTCLSVRDAPFVRYVDSASPQPPRPEIRRGRGGCRIALFHERRGLGPRATALRDLERVAHECVDDTCDGH